MNVVERNQLYLKGVMQGEGLFPHLEVAPASGFFNWDFGLAELPREPGITVIRGPRQYGKSTWLEFQLRATLRDFGPGTAFFLNGDYIAGPDELEREIESILPARAFCRNAGRWPRISARDSGKRVTISMRPARLSEIFGSVRILAEPVSRNLPGRRSLSMDCLMARSSSGAN